MGLLTFIGKKSHSDLKACGYDSAVALAPPILGTYPVPGNGAKILEQFQKAYPGVSSVCSTPQPRLLNDNQDRHDVERPNSAPSQQLGEAERASGSSSQHTSELPLASRKLPGPYRLPRALTDIQTTTISTKPSTWPASPSTYTASIRSCESSNAKAYVDLLEAQSKVKPVGFYDHIQAAGAKIYDHDENVARKRRDVKSVYTVNNRKSHPNHANASRSSVVSRDADDDADDYVDEDVYDDADGDVDDDVSENSRDDHDKHDSNHNIVNDDGDDEDDEDADEELTWPPKPRSAVQQGKTRDFDDAPASPKRLSRAATTRDSTLRKPYMHKKRQSLGVPSFDNNTRQKRNDLSPSGMKDNSRRLSSQSTTKGSSLMPPRPGQLTRSASYGGVYEDSKQRKISRQYTSKLTPDISPQARSHTVHRRLSDDFFLEDFASSDEEGPGPQTGGSYEKELLFLDTGFGKSGQQASNLPGLFERPGPPSGANSSTSRSPQKETLPSSGAGLLQMPAYFEADSDESGDEQFHSDYSDDQDPKNDNPLSRIVAVPRHVRGQEWFLASRKSSSKVGTDS